MSIETHDKPHVFVGSSTEQLRWSRAIQLELDNDAEVTVWPQGVFKPSRSEMNSLIAEARRCDFAIFVFGPDDIALMRSSRGFDHISGRWRSDSRRSATIESFGGSR
jgi:predicted nucleotide-binding protein